MFLSHVNVSLSLSLLLPLSLSPQSSLSLKKKKINKNISSGEDLKKAIITKYQIPEIAEIGFPVFGCGGF